MPAPHGMDAEVYSEPVYSELVYAEPVYSEPVYSEHVYSEPVYSEPVYAEPVYAEPIYSMPAGHPAAAAAVVAAEPPAMVPGPPQAMLINGGQWLPMTALRPAGRHPPLLPAIMHSASLQCGKFSSRCVRSCAQLVGTHRCCWLCCAVLACGVGCSAVGVCGVTAQALGAQTYERRSCLHCSSGGAMLVCGVCYAGDVLSGLCLICHMLMSVVEAGQIDIFAAGVTVGVMYMFWHGSCRCQLWG